MNCTLALGDCLKVGAKCRSAKHLVVLTGEGTKEQGRKMILCYYSREKESTKGSKATAYPSVVGVNVLKCDVWLDKSRNKQELSEFKQQWQMVDRRQLNRFLRLKEMFSSICVASVEKSALQNSIL